MDKVRNKDKLSPNKGKNSRQRGLNFERQLAKEFRELGYPRCLTTRNSSRVLDACKVDLDIPDFNIQAKNVKANIEYLTVFGEIEEALSKQYPERLEYITAIFHKRKGSQLVILKKKDFYKLVEMYLIVKSRANEVKREV